MPLPDRPGKMSDMPGAMPIETLPADDTGARVTPADGSVETALYRSSSEELDDVVWKIKTEHLQRSRVWNDMAVIAHDNAPCAHSASGCALTAFPCAIPA